MEIVMIRAVQLIPHAPPIEAIKLSDGSLGASIKSLCDLLDLARHGQTARIKRDPALASALVLVSMKTAAGSRLLDVLISYAIPPWLSGLQVTRLSPEKQERAALIRQGAIEAIERAFSDQENAAIPVIDAEPGLSAWQQAQEGLAAILSGVGQLQTAFSSMEHSYTVLLARMAALERPIHTSDKAGLPPERIAHLYILARAWRAKTGAPIAETFANLARHFHVADASDIPAAAWRDVLAWFDGLLGT
jgi:hypothetical protein